MKSKAKEWWEHLKKMVTDIGHGNLVLQDSKIMNHKTLEDVEEIIKPEIDKYNDELFKVGLNDIDYAINERLEKLLIQLQSLKL